VPPGKLCETHEVAYTENIHYVFCGELKIIGIYGGGTGFRVVDTRFRTKDDLVVITKRTRRHVQFGVAEMPGDHRLHEHTSLPSSSKHPLLFINNARFRMRNDDVVP